MACWPSIPSPPKDCGVGRPSSGLCCILRQWASGLVDGAAAQAEAAVEQVSSSVADFAQDAKDIAYSTAESAGIVDAVDYWESHTPNEVTAIFREALDERVSQHLGDTAGQVSRLLSTPVTAAARFSVQGARGVNALRRSGVDIAAGRAPLPSPGPVAAGVVVGTATYVGSTIDSLGKAVVDGASALADGDVEGVARAAEEGFKATYDAGAIAVAARGAASGGRALVSGGSGISGGGAAALQGAFNPAAVDQGALKIGASGAGLATLKSHNPRPIERRNTRRQNGRANRFPRDNLRGVSLKWLKKNKPAGWKTVTTRKNQGFIWKGQNNIERLRFMRPNSKKAVASKWSRQENGCFRWKNEHDQWLDIDGNVIRGTAEEIADRSHIAYEGPL